MFNILSSAYDPFELDNKGHDDACISAVSSTMGGAGSRIGSAPGDDDSERPDWETLDEGDREINISSSSKQLNNIKKR